MPRNAHLREQVTMLRTTATVAVVIVLLVGSLSGAAIGVDGERRASMHDEVGGNGEDLEASSGQQLATVVAVTDVEVRSGLEESDFEERLREGTEGERAAAVVERQTALLDRTDALVEERTRLTSGYESGRLDATAYAQQLVVLSARAMAVERSLVRLESSASSVSAVELEAAGYDPSATRSARSRLETVSGSGMSALLRLFTGEMGGSFDLRSEGGLSVEVENESGSSVREIERDVERGTTLSIPAGDAVEAASAFLSEPAEGNWTLRRVAADNVSGYYDVRFELRSSDLEGKARARVDGETGAVFRFEEEVERRDDRDDDGDDGPDGDDDRSETIDIAIVNGSTQPGATITILATLNGEPVADARVEVGGEIVGRTGGDGRLTLDLPDDEDEVEIEIETESPDAEGELELEFEGDDDDDRHSIDRAIRENLLVRGSIENGSATFEVTYAGDPVENVKVYQDDRLLGSTDADGSLESTAIELDDELELTLRKDRFETEVEFRFEGGELIRTEIETEFDDDREDDDHEERDDDRERDDDEDGEGDDDREGDDDDGEGDDDREEDDGDEDGEDNDRQDGDDDITVEVVSGTIEPGSSITILATLNGEPVADARVEVEGELVGRTGDDGRLTLDLPDDEDDVEIEVESPDADGELELDLDVGVAIEG